MKELVSSRHLSMSEKNSPAIHQAYMQTMIHYLLGELSESEKSSIEELVFREEDYFTQLQLLEDQLIEDYLYEVLPPTQRQKFETGYLISARRRQKLHFARTLKQTLETIPTAQAAQERPSGWQASLAFWPQPLWRYGVFVSVLGLLLLGSWLGIQSQREVTISRHQAPTPPLPTTTASQNAPATVLPKPPQLSPSAAQARANAPAREHQRTPGATIVFSVLSPGQWRDQKTQENDNTMVLRAQTTKLILQLKHTPTTKFSIFRATLETVSGQALLTCDKLKPEAQFLRVPIPAHRLAADDYVITVFGKTPQGEYEEVNDYSFRVIKK